jgi:SNF2 family DNA or RNA helicase
MFIRQQTQNKKCPYCRVETLDGELYILTKRKDKQKYNSKINRMLEVICSRPSEERFIIYTQFEKVLSLLANVFSREKKAFQIYQANVPVCESTSILLLSNVHTASGIELTAFSNIIIFEPFHDEKSLKFVEQQMIGRIYRIGQTRETNVYRLIVRNSIESEIYSISC